MAAKKAEKKYIVTVKNNPNFVGIGAGGIQFAQGKAEGVSERMAAWFKEHKGYDVVEDTASNNAKPEAKPE